VTEGSSVKPDVPSPTPPEHNASLKRGQQPPRTPLSGVFTSSLSSVPLSTQPNINVAPRRLAPARNIHFPAMPAQPTMAFGPAVPPTFAAPPPQGIAPAPSSVAPTPDPLSTPSQARVLPRGQDSGDTPMTAAARRERDAIRRDHRVATHGGDNVSSTPPLSEVRRRIADEQQASASGHGSPLTKPPNTSQLQTLPAVQGRPFLPFSQDPDDASFALSPFSRSNSVGSNRGRGRSNSVIHLAQSRDHSRDVSPVAPKKHCWDCRGCNSWRPMYMQYSLGTPSSSDFCVWCAAEMHEQGSMGRPPWGEDEVCYHGL
jgi:hypothetical protein